MPGADQHFWVKEKEVGEKKAATKFDSELHTEAPQLALPPPPAPRRAGISSFLKHYLVFADGALLPLEQLLIKKNRYSSLINATLNYNTMMSAVLIKYWLRYKELLAAVRVTIGGAAPRSPRPPSLRPGPTSARGPNVAETAPNKEECFHGSPPAPPASSPP